MRKVACFVYALGLVTLMLLSGRLLTAQAAAPKEIAVPARPAPESPAGDEEESFLLSFVGDCTLVSDALF